MRNVYIFKHFIHKPEYFQFMYNDKYKYMSSYYRITKAIISAQNVDQEESICKSSNLCCLIVCFD